MGTPTSSAKLKSGTIFVTAKASNPKTIDKIAALLPLLLNVLSNPRIIGTAIGPRSAANQETIKPNTPPNLSEFMAIIIVSRVKVKVVIRASFKDLPELRFFNLGKVTGRISRVITADTVFESEEVIDRVLANIDAKTNPINPLGRNFIAIIPYDWVGSDRLGKNKGAANMGNSRIRGHIKYSKDDSIPAFFASFGLDEEIKRAARFQVPPL